MPDLLTDSSTQAEAIAAINRISKDLAAGDVRGAAHDTAMAEMADAVKKLQSSTRINHTETTDEKDAQRLYGVRVDGSDEVKIILTRKNVTSDGVTFEMRGYLDDAHPGMPAIQRELIDLVEQYNIMRTLRRSSGKGNWHRDLEQSTPKLRAKIRRLVNHLPDAVKRAFVDVAGEGQEFIPEVTLPMVEMQVQWARSLASAFDVVNIESNNVKLPYMDSGAIPYIIAAPTSDDSAKIPLSSPVTDERSIVPVTMAARLKMSYNIDEDAMAAGVQAVRDSMTTAIVSGTEDAIYNGDTAATHQDLIKDWNPDGYFGDNFLATAGASTDHRRAWVGLRARAFDVSNTVDRGTLTFANLLTDQASVVGAPGPTGKILVASKNAIAKIAALEQFATIDKVGPAMASNVQGLAIGSICGMPVIPSQFATDDLNASGLFDNVTTDKGGYTICQADRFKNYRRRGLVLESTREPSTQMIELVSTQRGVFKTVASSTEKNALFAFNI